MILISTNRKQELTLSRNHPASHYGLAVLIYDEGEVLDGAGFRLLRDREGAKIITDNQGAVYKALGVPAGEPGIMREAQEVK